MAAGTSQETDADSCGSSLAPHLVAGGLQLLGLRSARRLCRRRLHSVGGARGTWAWQRL